MQKPARLFLLVFLSAVAVRPASLAQTQTSARAEHAVEHGYQPAPQPIHDLLNAAPTPLVLVSPKADQLLIVDRLPNPPITDLAQPMLRLAGLRINPATNGRHHPQRIVALTLVTIADGESTKLKTPLKAYLSAP